MVSYTPAETSATAPSARLSRTIPTAPSWQEALAPLVPAYARFFDWSFRHDPPEKREERTQEALVQTAVSYLQQYRKHRRLVANPESIGRTMRHKVLAGRSSTREPRQLSDLMDDTIHKRRCGSRNERLPMPVDGCTQSGDVPPQVWCELSERLRARPEASPWVRTAVSP